MPQRPLNPSSTPLVDPVEPGARPRFRLSKSRFLSGLQCQKRLYLEVHAPGLATPADPDRQALIDMGMEVGDLARSRFPGGILVAETYRQTRAAVQRTAELIQDPDVPAIFEGAFVFRDTLVRVDVLERLTENSWRLIEVKATSKVKPIHLHDVTIQTAVLHGQGIAVEQSCLMHINTKYIYQGGEIDLDQLFTLADLTDTVRDRQSDVNQKLGNMRQVLGKSQSPGYRTGWALPDSLCLPILGPLYQGQTITLDILSAWWKSELH